MNILIVDDNSLHIRMCRMLLEKMKHTVVSAMSLNELKKTSSSMIEPDVALIDFRLEPGVTGVDVFNFLKKEKKWNRTKYIALTADVGEKTNLDEAGFDNVIYKPITETQLSEILKKYE